MEPLRSALDGFINTTQRRVTGKVKLKLYKGGMRVVGRSSDFSLYKLNLSTYSKESTFDQGAAVGFIELWGLQSRLAAKLEATAEGRTKSGHPKRQAHQEVK
jgi:argininosuccinate synthase